MRKSLKTLLLVSAISLVGISGLTACKTEDNGTQQNQDTNTGTQEEKKYSVIIAQDLGFKVTSDKAEAKKGETITLTIEIPEEKELDKILINDAPTQFTVVKERSQYSFLMGESNAVVKVTLKDRVWQQHELAVNTVEGFQVNFFIGTNQVTTAKRGDQVKAVITRTINTKRFVSFTSTQVKLTQTPDKEEFTFVMVNEAVSFTLVCEDIPSRKLQKTTVEGAIVVFKQENKEVTTALEGSKVFVHINVDLANYTFTRVDFTGIDKTLVTTEQEGAIYSFVVGTSDVTVTPVVEAIPSYTISSVCDKGASISFTSNGKVVTSAREGDKIDLEVKLEAKYKLVSVSSDLAGFTLPELVENKCSFVMPKGNLNFTVKAEYVPEKFTVNSLTTYGPDANDVVGLAEKDLILEGTKVEGFIKYSSDFEHYTVLVNGTKVNAKYDANKDTGVPRKGAWVFDFVMPIANVDVVIYKSSAPLADQTADGFVVTTTENADLYTIYGIEANTKYEKSTSNFEFFIVPKKGVLIKNVSVTYDDDATKVEQLSETSFEKYQYTFARSTTKVTSKAHVTIDAERTGSFNIISANPEVELQGEILEVTAGSKVKLSLTAKACYKLESSSYSLITSATCDNSAIQFSKADVYVSTYSGVSIEFTMPKGNVTLEFKTYKAAPINVTLGTDVSSCKLTSDSYGNTQITEAYYGDYIYIFPTCIAGKKVNKVNVNNSLLTVNSSGYARYEVKSTDTAINVSFETVSLRKVNYLESATEYTITGLKNDYVVGDLVTFTVKAATGYEVTSVALDDATIKLTEDTYTKGEYSFTMPDKDVSIVVTTKKLVLGTISFDNYPAWYDGYGAFTLKRKEADRYYATDVKNGEQLPVGTEVYVEIDTGDYGDLAKGYELKGVTHNGKALTPTGYSTKKFTFTVVEGANNIVIDCVKTPTQAYTLNLVNKSALTIKGIYSNNSFVSTSNSGQLDEGKEARFEFTVNDATSFVYDETAVTLVDATGAKVPFTAVKTNTVFTVTFTQPASAVTLTVDPKPAAALPGNKVTVTDGLMIGDSFAVKVGTTNVANNSNVEANSNVVITINPYKYVDWESSYDEDNFYTYNYTVLVTGADGTVYVNNIAVTSRSQEVTFQMPDQAVTIALTAKRK